MIIDGGVRSAEHHLPDEIIGQEIMRKAEFDLACLIYQPQSRNSDIRRALLLSTKLIKDFFFFLSNFTPHIEKQLSDVWAEFWGHERTRVISR